MALHVYTCCCCVLLLVTLPWIQPLVLDHSASDSELLQTILHLQSDVGALKEEVLFLKSQLANRTDILSGPVPAFLASLDTTTTGCNDRAVIFDNVRLNAGSYYDVRHGLFRAPKNGTYHFAVTLSNPEMKSYHVRLIKNSPANVIGYLHLEPTNSWTERSTNILVQLQQGDDVWLQCWTGSNSFIQGFGFHSHFSGFYIGQ